MDYFWVFLIVVLIRVLFSRKKKNPTLEEVLKDGPPELVHFVETMRDIWHPDRLYQYFYREIDKWKAYETPLLKLYWQQASLLQDIMNRKPHAIAAAKEAIRRRLRLCQSFADNASVKNVFSWVIKQVPELGEMIILNAGESHQDPFSQQQRRTTSSTKPNKKELFAHCKSLEELKRRFRRLALLNHPDKGGCDKAMKEIIRQYEEAVGAFQGER